MKESNAIQESYSDLTPPPTGLVETNAHQVFTSAPAVTSNLQSVLKILGAFLLYLACTVVCLRLAWFIPGRGMEIILLRLLIGAWSPGAAVLVIYPVLKKKRRQSFIAGFLIGMFCVSIALTFGAIALSSKFRL